MWFSSFPLDFYTLYWLWSSSLSPTSLLLESNNFWVSSLTRGSVVVLVVVRRWLPPNGWWLRRNTNWFISIKIPLIPQETCIIFIQREKERSRERERERVGYKDLINVIFKRGETGEILFWSRPLKDTTTTYPLNIILVLYNVETERD